MPVVLLLLLALLLPLPVGAYDLPIMAVRSPRPGGDTGTSKIPDAFCPLCYEPGTDIVLLHPGGREEVLVAGVHGAAFDQQPGLDATVLYYAVCPDVRPEATNSQRHQTAYKQGCDTYKMDLATRQRTRLTRQAFALLTGAAQWAADPATVSPKPGETSIGYGVMNTAPTPLPHPGKVMFTSSRNGYLPNKDYTFPNFQLFVLDEYCQDAHGMPCVEEVGFLNLGSALHPVLMTTGEVMFSSYEGQGLRDKRLWGLWAIWPDGRAWRPLMSAFGMPEALHWQTEMSTPGGDILVAAYYINMNGGLGTLWRLAGSRPGKPMATSVPGFGSPVPTDPSNPVLRFGIDYVSGKEMTTRRSFSPVELGNFTPFSHSVDQGNPKGKVTMPSAGPNGDVVLVYSGPPANRQKNRPTNIPQIQMGIYIARGGKIVEDPSQLELVVTNPNYNYMQPKVLAPFKTIYGVEPRQLPWLPNDGTAHPSLPPGTPYGIVGTSNFDVRNTAPGTPQSNWAWQGADAGTYTDEDIYAVRILGMKPTPHKSYPSNNRARPEFTNGGANERLEVWGEIILHKPAPDGGVLLDDDGKPDTSFLAKIPGDAPFTFQTLDKHGHALNTSQTWHQVRPGEKRDDCGGCHGHASVGRPIHKTAAGKPGYVPHDLTQTTPWTVEWTDIEAQVRAFCGADCTGKSAQEIASAYAKPFQSRLSPLLEKMAGAPEDVQRQVRLWIDLGTPIDQVPGAWKQDATRPTLTLHVRQQPVQCPEGCSPTRSTRVVSIGAADLSELTGPPQVWLNGQEMRPRLTEEGRGVWVLPLEAGEQGRCEAIVEDTAGHTQRKWITLP